MADDILFRLIDAVRAEFGVRTGRNEWLNIASVGDLDEHLARVFGVRGEAERAELWERVAKTVGRATAREPSDLRPDSGFFQD